MSSTARRAFLTGAGAALAAGAAVPAAAVTPIEAASWPVAGAEPELEALYARFLASYATAEAATRYATEVEPVDLDPPAAALCQPGDEALELTNNVRPGGIAVGERYHDCFTLRHAARLKDFCLPHEKGYAAAARAAEILAALDAHREAIYELHERCGYAAADRAETEAWQALAADRDALATAQAATLRGVLMKARAIIATEHDGAGLEDWRQEVLEHEGGTSTGLAVSLTLDLIRMWGLMPASEAGS